SPEADVTHQSSNSIPSDGEEECDSSEAKTEHERDEDHTYESAATNPQFNSKEEFGVSSAHAEGPCQPITMPLCQGISYNLTAMPNLLGHKKQAEAAVKMAQLESVVKLTCSVDIRFFLVWKGPCRSLCERAKLGCYSVLNTFGMSWPDDLSCESFQRSHASFQKDKSGKLDVKEFHNLKNYVSVTKREYTESYEWQNPGFDTEYQMKNALDVRDLSLDDETFKILWDRYSSGGGIKYDDFMAILTRLKILK
ncbi:unnamed protein product, partial [Coregonus sp. 'balchen']